MKNGSALLTLAEELDNGIGKQGALAYYQQPIPAPADLLFDEAVEHYVTADQAARLDFERALSDGTRAQFGLYGHRAATRAVREIRPELLRLAIAGSVLANLEVPNGRRVEIGLAVIHHAARKLGQNPAELFAFAADLASPEYAEILTNFAGRDDITLARFGWKEIYSDDGVQYKFEWK